ncbi:MAG: hypothetical protein QM753_07340 [Thermomicrobiales bacterium]
MTQPGQAPTQVSVATLQISPAVQVGVPVLQEAVASSQVSTPLQATASLQSRARPWQRPAEQASLTVQNLPSSQRVLSAALLQVVLERAGLQSWQGLLGLVCAAP